MQNAEPETSTAATEAAATCPASQPTGPVASPDAVPLPDVLSVRDVARLLGRSTDTVRRLIALPPTHRDHLPSFHFLRQVGVFRSAWEAWKRRHSDRRAA